MSESVPKWISEKLAEARRLFGLGGTDWHFTVKMTDKPGGNYCYFGSINCDSVYQDCEIEFSNELIDDKAGKITVYHEVAHAAHENIDHLVKETLLNEIPKDKRGMLHKLYIDEVENFIQRLSRSIVENIECNDNETRVSERNPFSPVGVIDDDAD